MEKKKIIGFVFYKKYTHKGLSVAILAYLRRKVNKTTKWDNKGSLTE